MRGLLVALLLMTMALAGCTDGDGDDPAPTSSSSTSTSRTTTTTAPATSSSTTTSSSSTTSTAPPANKPPIGSLAATVNGTAANFTVTGSDPDGDKLSWALAFGDGNATQGTSLPATVLHTYPAGNYTATLTLNDGKTSAIYTLDLAATQGKRQLASGEFRAGGLEECGFGEYPEQLDGITHAVFALDPATVGRPFTATINVTVPAIGPLDVPGVGHFYRSGVDFVDAERVYVKSYGSDVAVVQGVVVAAALVGIWACGGGGATFTYASS